MCLHALHSRPKQLTNVQYSQQHSRVVTWTSRLSRDAGLLLNSYVTTCCSRFKYDLCCLITWLRNASSRDWVILHHVTEQCRVVPSIGTANSKPILVLPWTFREKFRSFSVYSSDNSKIFKRGVSVQLKLAGGGKIPAMNIIFLDVIKIL